MERDANLSLFEQLLLAQTVNQGGTDPPEWGSVSARMMAHPLLAGDAAAAAKRFSTMACEQAWSALMRAHAIMNNDRPRTDRAAQLALAQLLYAARLEELHAQIAAKEQQFRFVVVSC